MTKCKCPKCDRPDCDVQQDEADIGVGTQVFVYGFECKDCGQISLCRECGQPDFKPHANWCGQFEESA